MSAPTQATIICPACPPANRQLLAIALGAADVRCPVCRRRFRLVTRQVKSSRSTRLDLQRTRYEVLTREGKERTRLRRVIAPPNVPFASGSWVTLVYRGELLLGVAEQTSSFWYPVPFFAVKHGAHRRLLTVLSVICLLLVALQLDRLIPALRSVAGHSQGAVALILLAAFLAAPALLWALQTGWKARPQHGLPPSASGWPE